MKATLFAVVFTLFVIPFTSYAEPDNITPATTPPPLEQAAPKINLNTADVSTLTQSFKGVGRKRAEAIIAYREANGGFKSIQDLVLVKGIGNQFIERNLKKLEETYSVE